MITGLAVFVGVMIFVLWIGGCVAVMSWCMHNDQMFLCLLTFGVALALPLSLGFAFSA